MRFQNIVVNEMRLVPVYFHHGTKRGIQSMGSIFIPRDQNIDHREIHGKLLPQKKVLGPRKSLDGEAI
jgi:hypothetical protein